MDSIADEAVVATNDDAAICKYQASLKGYYSDPFIEKFLSAKMRSCSHKKAPEINRGYFIRSVSIAYIVEKFIETHPNAQVISLGAGYDTLFWRLHAQNLKRVDGENNLAAYNYVEVDMSPVVVHKIMSIRRHAELSRSLESICYKGEALHSRKYHLISADFRQVDKTPLRSKLFNDCQLDPDKPTICIAECVLVYMPTQDSSSLIKWLSDNFTMLTIVNYEQCNMTDRFGDIMLANMNARHCDLMGVDACKSIASQIDRFKMNGMAHAKGWTLLQVYKKCILPDSVAYISELEFLDEQELLEQLLEHYCIVVASHREVDWISEIEYWLSKSTKANPTQLNESK